MKKPHLYIFVLALLGFATFSSCNKCKDPICFEVPGTYDFTNVDYSGQTQRLDMMAEMTSYMKTSNTIGTSIDASVLKEMFANEGNHFSTVTSSKQLKNKCFILDQGLFEGYMDALAAASQSTVAGSNGQAGVVESLDGNKGYLFDENGWEYTQLIEKGLMGAVFYYQAMDNYLSEAKIGASVDNENISVGEGTDMEHHWDEAFGYLGLPVNFPANTDDARFHGKYCNSRDGLLGTNAILMDAFTLGRAAISNKDMDVKNDQISLIRNGWELVIASTAMHYLNAARTNFADNALRNHELSEATAFIGSLKYNPEKNISNSEIDAVLSLIGDNFYESVSADLLSARDQLSTIFGLDNLKDQF